MNPLTSALDRIGIAAAYYCTNNLFHLLPRWRTLFVIPVLEQLLRHVNVSKLKGNSCETENKKTQLWLTIYTLLLITNTRP
jgi:hypothetical protein